DVREPGARILRYAFLRPLEGRRGKRLLHGVLSRAEVAEATREDADDLRNQLAKESFVHFAREASWQTSVGGPDITSRTSIFRFIGAPPGPGAPEARAAMAYAC